MSESTLFVQRGKTVQLNGNPHGPGATVMLPADDAARLKALGFVAETAPILTAPEIQPNPSGIGPSSPNVQGPRY